MVSCLIQLEEKRSARREREFRESFWIFVHREISLSYFFSLSFSAPFIPLRFNTRGCIVEKVV